MRFGQIEDHRLDGEQRMARIAIGLVDPDEAEERVGLVAKGQQIAAFAHVAVVIDPFGRDRRADQPQRCRDRRGGIPSSGAGPFERGAQAVFGSGRSNAVFSHPARLQQRFAVDCRSNQVRKGREKDRNLVPGPPLSGQDPVLPEVWIRTACAARQRTAAAHRPASTAASRPDPRRSDRSGRAWRHSACRTGWWR